MTAAAAAGNPDGKECKDQSTLHATVTRGYFNVSRGDGSGCVAVTFLPARTGSTARLERITAGADVSLRTTADGIVLRFSLPKPDGAYHATGLVNGVAMDADDTIELWIYPAGPHGDAKPLMRAVSNYHLKCFTATRRVLVPHDLCSCARGKEGGDWAGELHISFANLRTAGVGDDFDIAPRLRMWDTPPGGTSLKAFVFDGVANTFASSANQKASASGLSASEPLVHVALSNQTQVIDQRYVILSTDLGNHAAGIPRRTGLDVWHPLTGNTLISATLSDDSASLLGERQKVMNGIVPDKRLVKSYDCRICYTFQTTDADAFEPLLKTSDIVHLDFQSLGLDTVPIDFSSFSSPIDGGVKLVSRDDHRTFAAAKFKGTSATSSFDDAAYRFSDLETFDRSSIAFGVFHAVANHGAPPAFATSPRSVTTMGSVAYTTVDEMRRAREPIRQWTSLARFGTQYVPGSRHVELLEAFDAAPGAKPQNAAGEQTTMHYALGYRDVGSRYLPYDAPVDPLGGTHGFLGGVGFDRRIVDDPDAQTRDHSLKPLRGSVVMHRFEDLSEVRDFAITTTLDLDIRAHGTLHLQHSSASVAASVAARSAGLFISPALGATLLDNSQSLVSYVWSGRSHNAWSVGYQRLGSPNCSKKITTTAQHPLPCDPYRQGSATAALFLPLGRDGFVAGNIGNSLAEPFANAFASNQTTVNRIRRTIAVGMPAGPCSHFMAVATNRAGDIDLSTQTRDRPGLYLASFLEMTLPRPLPQALLVGYVSNQDFSTDKTSVSKREFFVRFVSGSPPKSYSRTMNCGTE
jgi:hypothetical protein